MGEREPHSAPSSRATTRILERDGRDRQLAECGSGSDERGDEGIGVLDENHVAITTGVDRRGAVEGWQLLGAERHLRETAMRADLGHGALEHGASLREEHDTGRELLRLGELLRRQENGASRRGELGQVPKQRAP